MNENQKIDETQKPTTVFYAAGIIVLLFVIWGAISPTSLNEAAQSGLSWTIENFGWFYMLITAFFVFFVIFLAISPFGKLRLGKPEDQPEYTWFSWIGMLFAAGIGVGFVFWGVAEPILYYLEPPVGITPKTADAAVAGVRYGAYHWALHPWAIFSLVGLTLAYVQYRKDQPALISSAFYPLIGEKINGPGGQVIDTLAVIATSTGVATTFGLSAMQISGGLSYLTGIPNTALTQMSIIVVVTILFMFSAAGGVDKGIKILSNINLVIAGILLAFVILVGPTIFIFENMVSTLGGYITNLVPMSLTLTPFSDSQWLGTNTIFFWAWHISWAPFMGIFIARISKGRTIREFIAGVLIVPSILAIIWFSAFGGTALHVELFGAGGISELVLSEVEIALFVTLAELPLSAITTVLAVVLILVFFITSADSASYVLGAMTSKGTLTPKMWVKLAWGFLIAGTASVLLLSGGGGLDALQTASIITALPFALVMLMMVVSILIMFSKDLRAVRKQRVHRERKTIENQIQSSILDDVKEHVSEEFIKSDSDQMKTELKEEIYDEVKDELYEEIKNEAKEELYEEIKEDIYKDIKEDLYEEVKEGFKEMFDEDKDS
ncbi:BCCT family transporter [Serpentinicella sp. ANB-PHB4]|uniref:BCCT family transporter n=1 Tax=Serpentinicella sp. ANB-PHB4 TaxID=3074076 RepID=UPI002860A575|nr:BCCT family transporter [Serpentinicella sp. ANB-PHB4]MDR5658558.1 BCCT family transporter [Serpentinicella sp. ANB-PHB4]